MIVSRPIRRLVFFGEFGCGNFGNEASLDAVHGWLADDVPCRVITREPERVEAEHSIPAVSMFADRRHVHRLPRPLGKVAAKIIDQARIMTLINRSDLVVVPGTGVFEQQLSGPPWGLALGLAGLAIAVRLRGARLALVGVGASYDTRPIVRAMNRLVVRSAKYVSVRDVLSLEGLAAIGCNGSRIRVFPDVAFGLEPKSPSVRPPTKSLQDFLRVGLGVLAYHDPDDASRGAEVAERYERAVTEFARQLVRDGHQVSVLIGDASDVPLAERVRRAASQDDGPGTIDFIEISTYRSLIDIISTLDVVVGSRYHNLIFALLTSIPALSIGYADKCQSLLADARMDRYALRLEKAGTQDMTQMFDELVAKLPDATDRAAAFRAEALEASLAHRADFLAAFTGTSGVLDRAQS